MAGCWRFPSRNPPAACIVSAGRGAQKCSRTQREADATAGGLRSTSSWSAPGLPACTCCTACAGSACRRWRSRLAATSAAPGTGTAIPARAATWRACSTRFSFSDELQQDWHWSERYAAQPEILTLRAPRRRPLRPAPRHPVRDPRDRAAFRRSGRVLANPHRSRRCRARAVLRDGDRVSVDREAARTAGIAGVSRRHLPHRRVAARGGGFYRADGWRDRHRILGDPGDPDDRAAGGAAVRVPAHRAVQHTRLEPADDAGVRARVEVGLRRPPAPRDGVAHGHSFRAEQQVRRWRRPRRSGSPNTKRAGRPAASRSWLRSTTSFWTRRPTTPPPNSCAQKSARSCATPRSPTAHAEGPSRSAPSGSASIPAISTPTTAPTSRWSTCSRTPIEAITPAGCARADGELRARHASCSPPASTR